KMFAPRMASPETNPKYLTAFFPSILGVVDRIILPSSRWAPPSSHHYERSPSLLLNTPIPRKLKIIHPAAESIGCRGRYSRIVRATIMPLSRLEPCHGT